MKYSINTPTLRSTVIEMKDGSLLEVRRGEETFRRKKQNERRIFANRAEWLRLVDGKEEDVKSDGAVAGSGSTESTTADWKKMRAIFTKYGINSNLLAGATRRQQLDKLQKQMAWYTKYNGRHYYDMSSMTKAIDALNAEIAEHGGDVVSHYSRKFGCPSCAQVKAKDGSHKNFYLSRTGLMEYDGKRGTSFAELEIDAEPEVWVCCAKTNWNSVKAEAI
jgi:hypothetical protein